MRLLLALLLSLAALPAVAGPRVTDLLGEEVTLPRPATRLVLGEGRHLSVLALLHDDPVALVAGWRDDKGLDAPSLAAWREAFPAIDAIRTIGSGNRDFSVEATIALAPDLVILSLADAQDAGMTRARAQLAAAGIPVVHVDFFAHPLENTLPSLDILATLTGAPDRAEDIAAFYTTRLAHIRDTLTGQPRAQVFLHAHAGGAGCCATVGQGAFREFIEAAGGTNIATDTVPGVAGTVSLEWLISADPAFYVATGGHHLAPRGGLVLGPATPPDSAAQSLETLTASPGLASLGAIRDGKATGIWHLFNDSPTHIALIEHLARTFHPTLFPDLDPETTLRDFNTRFSALPLPGTYWSTLLPAVRPNPVRPPKPQPQPTP